MMLGIIVAQCKMSYQALVILGLFPFDHKLVDMAKTGASTVWRSPLSSDVRTTINIATSS